MRHSRTARASALPATLLPADGAPGFPWQG